MVSWRFLLEFAPIPWVFARNVDGLHQAAGSSADLVVEVHGSTQDSLKLDVEMGSWENHHL